MPGFMINGTGADKIGGKASATVETRRAYRWVFKDISDGPPAQALVYLKTCSRPHVILEPIEMHHNQERAWFAGKTNWEPITMSWYDMEQDPDTSKGVYDWLEIVSVIKDANVALPEEYKKTGDLAMLDHAGEVSEQWKIYNCWPHDINWNELDFSSNEIILISISMRYDRAERVT